MIYQMELCNMLQEGFLYIWFLLNDVVSFFELEYHELECPPTNIVTFKFEEILDDTKIGLVGDCGSLLDLS